MKVLPIKLPDEMYDDLKAVSVRDGMPMAQVIRDYLGTKIKKKAKIFKKELRKQPKSFDFSQLGEKNVYTGPTYFDELTDDEILYDDPVRVLLRKLQKKILPILKKHNVKKAGIFGSATTNDFSSESDVDLLYEPPPGTSLFDHFQLKNELEEKLKRPVDLVEYKYLKPRIRDRVLQQVQPIL
ncbi:MAG: nucleotidyltransferase family protein [Patescibacteria group bacterium]